MKVVKTDKDIEIFKTSNRIYGDELKNTVVKTLKLEIKDLCSNQATENGHLDFQRQSLEIKERATVFH